MTQEHEAACGQSDSTVLLGPLPEADGAAEANYIADDQAWERAAEQLTRQALGADVDRPINPHATTVDEL